MHELSLMESVLEIASRHAEEQAATRIHSITIRIGDMSGVSIDALTFAFDVLARETIAAEASLNVVRVPARCKCPECDHEFETDSPFATCPRCGTLRTELVQGREIELASMEVS